MTWISSSGDCSRAPIAVGSDPMHRALRSLLAPLRPLLRKDAISFEGVTLPAPHLRTGGVCFIENDVYLASARGEAKRMTDAFRLTQDQRLLDIGCGTGRLAIGLLSILKDTAPQYVGMDISMTAVRWCRKYIAADHTMFSFLHLPLRNERYNPAGIALDDTFHFPWPDASFDVLYLYSVFSHMRSPEIRIYLREFRRLLRQGGHVFLTAFTEADVPEEMENPSGYQDDWKGPLHCVRFETGFFVRMLEEAGLMLDRYDHGTETDGQSGYYLSLKP